MRRERPLGGIIDDKLVNDKSPIEAITAQWSHCAAIAFGGEAIRPVIGYLYAQILRDREQESRIAFGVQVEEHQRAGLVRRVIFVIHAEDQDRDGARQMAVVRTRQRARCRKSQASVIDRDDRGHRHQGVNFHRLLIRPQP
jgi:hypothetical protein